MIKFLTGSLVSRSARNKIECSHSISGVIRTLFVEGRKVNFFTRELLNFDYVFKYSGNWEDYFTENLKGNIYTKLLNFALKFYMISS